MINAGQSYILGHILGLSKATATLNNRQRVLYEMCGKDILQPTFGLNKHFKMSKATFHQRGIQFAKRYIILHKTPHWKRYSHPPSKNPEMISQQVQLS